MSDPGDGTRDRGGRAARPPFAWLALVVAAGVAIALLYRDSYQQDAGAHFLRARWAWREHWMFVDVWARPLFTTLYSLPAQLGYPAAKLTTVVVSALTAWQTWRIAEDEGLERAWLAIPLLFLQPTVLLLCADTMTEPLFALVFVTALRLHRRGRVRAGMIVASLMALARPEGFFLALLWGVWVLFDRRDERHWWRRIPSTLWLATGVVAWFVAAYAITDDPLFILHNWPSNWSATGSAYGHGPLLTYWYQRSTIAGRLLYVPFLVGLVVLLARRRLGTATSSFLVIFVLHSLLWRFGKMGSAGYARYFVCVAPATALITLAGWNEVARRFAPAPRGLTRAVAAAVLLYSALSALSYVDSHPWSRDARAVDRAYAWFRSHERRPVRALVFSQAYMCIRFDCDPMRAPALSGDSARNVALLRAAAPGTLVFWDGDTGPAWFGLRAPDIAAAGYEELYAARDSLHGRFPLRIWQPFAETRAQEMHLLYKVTSAPPVERPAAPQSVVDRGRDSRG